MAKSKSLLPRGFKTAAENIALEHRSLMGLEKYSPLDAFALAKYLDIPAYPISDILSKEDSRKLTHPADPKDVFSAMWMRNCDGDKIIIYNSSHSPYRQQSDLMHELAHIIRKHEMSDEVRTLSALLNLRSFDKQQEEEAAYLGACLQLPREALLWALQNNYSEQKMVEYFCASPIMVKFRLDGSGARIQFSRRRR